MCKMYSVYDKRRGGLPVVVLAPAAMCAAAMGIEIATFRTIVHRIKTGTYRSVLWEVVEEERGADPRRGSSE